MFIDSKGKLFGMINIIDLTVILFIGILIAGGAYKLSSLKNMSIEDQKQISVTIEFEEETKGLVDAIKEGDILFDSVRGTEFGRVIGKNIKPHQELVINKDGKVEYKEIPESFDGQIKLNSMAFIDEDGILIATKPIYIGSEIRLKSNMYVFDCKVSNIEY
ncbi:DUF4330 domain-containing protein [Paramaledivibacter caminithermalis]|jgi:hypothetical protein|uniref:DUF4330 domain-containing protein n=1 Tax=Paramaledivibacter caminithermalis (strain DSM 15212 / CIP 107654 / DViRD3) TaxID=1121301 RepID=A0A1M6KSC1_PARC5|nr:DUF4330 domain-containing protein [Paramaledivibacter caminithermalis]SHJ61843.1 protein of unknown function [Paramaledivibacter caminithermalis DSM 15212]